MLTRLGLPPRQSYRPQAYISNLPALRFAALEHPPLPKEGKGWPTQPWYKKLLRFRYTLPLLAAIPIFTPSMYVSNTYTAISQRLGIPEQKLAKAVNDPQPVQWSYWAGEKGMQLVVALVILGALSYLDGRQLRSPSKTFGTGEKEWITYHELGHFLAWLGSGDTRAIQGVTLKPGATIAGAVTEDPCNLLGDYPTGTLDEQDILKSFVVTDGGETLERLLYGYSSAVSGSVDRFEKLAQLFTTLKAVAKSQPKELFKFARFIFSRKPYATAVIKQFDFATVQALAKRLYQDQTWDAAQIEAIVKEFKLLEQIEAQKQIDSDKMNS